MRRNEEVAQRLEDIAKLLATQEESPRRIRAYEQAAHAIQAMGDGVEALYRARNKQAILKV